MGLELLGQLVVDPLNLIPASWLGKAKFGKAERGLARALEEVGQVTDAEKFLDGARGLKFAQRTAHYDHFSQAVLRVPLSYADELG